MLLTIRAVLRQPVSLMFTKFPTRVLERRYNCVTRIFNEKRKEISKLFKREHFLKNMHVRLSQCFDGIRKVGAHAGLFCPFVVHPVALQ
jgi:hypothetical protein